MIIDIRLTVDYAFKRVFGDEKSKGILISLLNAVMGFLDDRRIVSVTLKNPFSRKDFDAKKQNILDIKAEDNFGNLYDIEMQVVIYESYPKRILHYACNMYSEQIEAGESFSKLNPVISINIIDSILFTDNDRYANQFVLRNKENDLILTEDLTFYTFELPKFQLQTGELSEPLNEWLYFIKHAHEIDYDNPPDFKYIPIKEIVEVLKKMNKNKLERQQYEDRMRAQSEILTIQEDSYNKGIEKGIEKGDKKARVETAKKMKEKGIDIEFIVEVTGLSKDEIEKL